MHIQRHCNRWRLNAQARIFVNGAEQGMRGVVHDISFKGMSISIPAELATTSLHRIKAVLDKGLVCYASCGVVWEKHDDGAHCYGLYFERLPDQEKDRIYEYVRQHAGDQINRVRWDMDADTDAATEQGGCTMDDRRIFQRFDAHFPLSFLDVNHGREGTAETFDISAKGLGISSEAPLDPRTPLELWLRIPDQGEPLYTRGYVVWSKLAAPEQYHIGINLERADLMGLSRVMRLP
jgi:hypothetical protein